jgi:hypothetical protein
MTTSKIVENTGVPELEKAEHRGKDILKKEEVQSIRHFDETWVPGQGILSQCLDLEILQGLTVSARQVG